MGAYNYHVYRKLGDEAEESFIKVAQDRGYKTRRASPREDCQDHIDIWVTDEDSSEYGVDVKCPWRVPMKDVVWISLHGSSEMNLGWIYGGKAHYIAFDIEDEFILVPRLEILHLLERNLVDEFVTDKRKAIFRKYKLGGKNEHTVLTLVKIQELRKLAGTLIWDKPSWMMMGATQEEKRTCHHRTNSFGRAHWYLYWETFGKRKPSSFQLKGWLWDLVEVYDKCLDCGSPLSFNKNVIYGGIERFLRNKKGGRYRAEIAKVGGDSSSASNRL